MKPTFTGHVAAQSIPVYAGDGIVERCARMIASRRRGLPVALVSDTNVFPLHGRSFAAWLRKAGARPCPLVLPAGEDLKSARTVNRLHEEWFAQQFDRTTPVIALGGGTISDAVGFATATFLRGLPLWQIPTTLLGQVDAAIGGKVGINHRFGKNLIGAFYQPSGIVIDPSLLQTLPPRELCSGLAEVVKYGVIADTTLFVQCEHHINQWITGKSPIPQDLIRRCVKIKLDIVGRDERDGSVRQILNFGHTLGHAIERWGGFRRFRHGEAVAMGMLAAGHMAVRRELFPSAHQRRLEELVTHLIPPMRSFSPSAAALMAHISVDKKRRAGKQQWIIPRRIGRVMIVDDLSDREIRDAIAYLAQWARQHAARVK